MFLPKTILLLVSVVVLALLTGCVGPSSSPAKLTLGKSKLLIEKRKLPDGTTMTFESFDFTAQLTNVSPRTIWWYGLFRPNYAVYYRPDANAVWKEDTLARMCNFGWDYRELQSGFAIQFPVSVPGDQAGHQVRLDLPIYLSPDKKAKPVRITSGAIHVPAVP